MAAYSIAALKAEVQSDPSGLGLAPLVAARNDAGSSALLDDRTKGASCLQPIPVGTLLLWGARTGVRAAIEAKVGDAAVGSLCLAVRDLLQGGAGALDMTQPAVTATGGLLDALTAAGVLPANAAASGQPPTPGSKADLVALATVPCSRAESLWGYGTTVPVADVSAALNGS